MNFDSVGAAFLASLIAGLATALGAVPVFFKKQYSKSFLNFAMGVSAGIMLVASFLSLLLPGIAHAETLYSGAWGLILVLGGLFIGYLSIISIHEQLPHDHLFKAADVENSQALSRVMLIVLAITLHNFPEGLAVGVGFGSSSAENAVTLTLAIAAQNIPEGLIIAFGLVGEAVSRKKAFTVALLSGLVEPLAAVIGFLSTKIASFGLPVAFGFAAGAMLFVVCQEMFPELFREGREKSATLGVILGIMGMFALNHLINA